MGDQVVVQGRRVLSRGSAVPADGIGMDVDQPGGLQDATAFGDVVQDGGDFVRGQVGAVQRGAFALGEAAPAGAAVEEPKLAELAESAGDGEISGVAASEVGAAGILATEARE